MRSRDVQGVIPRAAAKEIKELSALDAQEGVGGVFVVWTDVHLKSGQHRTCFPSGVPGGAGLDTCLEVDNCRRCSALRRAIRGTMRQLEHAESVPPGAAHGVRTAGGLGTDRRAGRKGADPYTREEGVSGYRLGNIAHCVRGSEVDGVLF